MLFVCSSAAKALLLFRIWADIESTARKNEIVPVETWPSCIRLVTPGVSDVHFH